MNEEENEISALILIAGKPHDEPIMNYHFVIAQKGYADTLFPFSAYDEVNVDWLKYFKFRIYTEERFQDLELLVVDKWQDISFVTIDGVLTYSFQDDKTRIVVDFCGSRGKTTLTFYNENITVTIPEPRFNHEFWNGNVPAAIFLDYVKQMELFDIVKGYE